MKNSDRPISPQPFVDKKYCDEYRDAIIGGDWLGLTKREYFAAKAMQGVLCDFHIMDLIRCDDDKDTAPFVAGLSVEYADALLHELEKE